MKYLPYNEVLRAQIFSHFHQVIEFIFLLREDRISFKSHADAHTRRFITILPFVRFYRALEYYTIRFYPRELCLSTTNTQMRPVHRGVTFIWFLYLIYEYRNPYVSFLTWYMGFTCGWFCSERIQVKNAWLDLCRDFC